MRRASSLIAVSAINDNERRMVGLEGHVGRREGGEGSATLWEGVQAAEARIDGVEEWVGGTLTREIRQAKEQSLRAHSVASSASRTCAQYLGTGAQASFLQPLRSRMDARR